MAVYAVNDPMVGKRLKELSLIAQHRCFQKHGLSSSDCWCHKAGSDGQSLPCSTACPEENFK